MHLTHGRPNLQEAAKAPEAKLFYLRDPNSKSSLARTQSLDIRHAGPALILSTVQ